MDTDFHWRNRKNTSPAYKYAHYRTLSQVSESVRCCGAAGGTPVPLLGPKSVQEFPRIKGALRCLFMLEVGKYVAVPCQMLLNPCNHRLPLFRCVGRLAETVIGKICSYDVRSDSFLCLGNAQSCILLAQRCVGFVYEP